MTEELTNRLAVLTRLVKQSPSRNLGRTAMMKLAYFLTTLRGVQLGYRFSLYSYGPFDATVLQDVDLASNLGALRSRLVRYQSGTGYAIQPDAASDEIEQCAGDFLNAHADDIQWVIDEFGTSTAGELELSSTIVYIDREASVDIGRTELAKRVRDVKPHFSTERILANIHDLQEKNLLITCS